MKRKIPLWIRVLPVYILVFGLIYMPVAAQSVRSANQREVAAAVIAQPVVKVEPTQHIAGRPVKVLIPSVGISNDMVDGHYDAKKGWYVSTTAANYAVNTPLPNNTAGNTIIYGHDHKAIFKPTANMKPGDKLYMQTDIGKTFIYEYRSYTTTIPVDTSVFAGTAEGKPRLTLITCTGTFSEKRRLMSFDFVGISQ